LGLSLAYNIIKAHGGEIKVETAFENDNPKIEGCSELVITLPPGLLRDKRGDLKICLCCISFFLTFLMIIRHQDFPRPLK
jgi:hypothetical protein